MCLGLGSLEAEPEMGIPGQVICGGRILSSEGSRPGQGRDEAGGAIECPVLPDPTGDSGVWNAPESDCITDRGAELSLPATVSG